MREKQTSDSNLDFRTAPQTKMAIKLKDGVDETAFVDKLAGEMKLMSVGQGQHVRGPKNLIGNVFILDGGKEVDVSHFKAEMIRKYEEQQKMGKNESGWELEVR